MTAFALQALNVQSLTFEKANLETTICLIDMRRMHLSYRAGFIGEEKSEVISKYFLRDKVDEDGNTVDNSEFDYEELCAEYEAQEDAIQQQDKILEIERTNLQTKLEMITTSLEGAEKLLQKGAEEFKGVGN